MSDAGQPLLDSHVTHHQRIPMGSKRLSREKEVSLSLMGGVSLALVYFSGWKMQTRLVGESEHHLQGAFSAEIEGHDQSRSLKRGRPKTSLEHMSTGPMLLMIGQTLFCVGFATCCDVVR